MSNYIKIKETPLAPERTDPEIYYREQGHGQPLIFLHSGWGYEVYPFERQLAHFAGRYRVIMPDRTGYGRSGRINRQYTDFHRRASVETFHLMDALGIARAILWGHSDGAVISAIMALAAPERVCATILEAFHYDRAKPGSREFFTNMVYDPEQFGERVSELLRRDHGEDYWRELLAMNGRAWLQIIAESRAPLGDFYQNRLGELAVPTLFLHGSRDPRTEPDEMATVMRLVPQARFEFIDGGHSPHSSESTAAECTRIVDQFLQSVKK